jgi:hypothetical protein
MRSPKLPRSRTKYIVSAIGFFAFSLVAVVTAAQIPQFSTWFINASKSPANLSVDFQSRQIPLTPIWKNLAQGGESPAFDPSLLQPQLTQLQPEYIRIDHLYDFYVIVGRDPHHQLTFDFSRLDQLLSQIRRLGATPFISLSYMPTVFNGDITGAPVNYPEYATVIQKTIEHVSGKNQMNIPNVYYEVWNEPDLFGQWKTYGDKNYLTLYQFAAQAANSATNVHPFKFGGPATTKLYKNWILGLVKHALNHNLRLDFISWHFYHADPQAVNQDISQLKAWMQPYPDLAKRLQIIISEWGIDSNNHPAYDNQVSAAHLVATISRMVPVIDRAFIFEIEDGKGPQAYWGRWGLFTHPDYASSPKPRAEAVALLNQLGPNQLAVNGQGGWVKAIATKQNQQLSLIIANYDLSNTHSEAVPLTITNLSPGTYSLSQTYLGRNPTLQTVTVSSTTYTTTLALPPNAVVLVSLIPEK